MINNVKLHKPVLLNEVLNYLNASEEGVYVDATFGAGGYSRSILKSNQKNYVCAIDRDATIGRIAEDFLDNYPTRFSFVRSKFSKLNACLESLDISEVDGIVFDLGVSSMQLDEANRGFSFSKNSMLDMRMGDNDISAFEVINSFSAEDLANIIFQYGEERYSRRIAKFICNSRKINPITSTVELAELVKKAKPRINFRTKIHPATKTFQAIRIFVNKELEEITMALEIAKERLKKGGRLVVVSFHGLEDKIVKNFMKEHSGKGRHKNRYLPEESSDQKCFEILTKKLVKPGMQELEDNPRSRSAILRAVRRL